VVAHICDCALKLALFTGHILTFKKFGHGVVLESDFEISPITV
jgi:hypothetical protein